MSDHQRFKEWSGAYVLGALDPEDRRSFEAHLGTCEECRDMVADFTPLPGLLNHVELEGLESAPESIVATATEMIHSGWRQVERSRGRWRWTAGLAAAVAIVALVVPLIGGTEPGDGIVLALESSSPTTGAVIVEEKPWGTAVEIEVAALPVSDRYVVWAVSESGEWEQMAAWGPTPNQSARLVGASSIPTKQLAAVVITTGDRADTIATAEVAA